MDDRLEDGDALLLVLRVNDDPLEVDAEADEEAEVDA